MAEKAWKALRAKQKQKLSEIMFEEICVYYRAHQQMPEGVDLEALAERVYIRCQGRVPGLSYETVRDIFLKKQVKFAERIAANGLPEPLKPKVKKTEAEKLAIKRAARKRKRAKAKAKRQSFPTEQDDRFFFIAGYTSGSAPYGVTWEEMGMECSQDIE